MSSNDSPERENDHKHERDYSPRPSSRERSPAHSDREMSPNQSNNHHHHHREHSPIEDLEDTESRYRRRDRSRSPRRGYRYSRSPPPRGPPPRERNPGHTLFISPLAPDCKEEDIERKFSHAGRVSKVSIVYDPHSHQHRGFGFVDMETREEADEAIETLNNSELLGTPLKVEKARRSAPRKPTPGHYMGARPRSRRRHDYPPPPPYGPPPRGGYYYYPMPPVRSYRYDPYPPPHHHHHHRYPPMYRGGGRSRRASPPSPYGGPPPVPYHHHHHHPPPRRSPSPPYPSRRYSRSHS